MVDAELRKLERDLVYNLNDPFFRCKYGWALLRVGRMDDARAQFCFALDGFVLDDELRNSKLAKEILKVFPALCYRLVQWEPRAPRERRGCKRLLSFISSMVLLRRENYVRHPHPKEVFGLIIDGILGRLNNQQLQNVYADMMDGYGEWFNLAFEREEDVLFVYVNPEGLEYDATTHTYSKTENFKSTEIKTFDVSEKDSGQFIGLNNFSDDFVEFFYGCSFADLPEQIKNYASVWLPVQEQILPVGRDGFDNEYDIGVNYDGWASRGVR